MSNSVATLQYNDQISVGFTNDAWFNATTVAKNYNKLPNEWLRLESTKEYIMALHTALFPEIQLRDYPVIKQNQLVRTKTGSQENGGGAWFHPKLAVAFARWLDVKFAVWCDIQIDKLLHSKSSYGLVELESVNKTQWGILSAMVSDISIASGKEGTTKAALWSRFSNHFKIGGYKELPAVKFDDAVSYLDEKREQYDKGFTLAVVKKDDLLALGYDTDTKMFAVQALPTPKPKHTNGRTSVQQQMPNIRVDISMDDVENLVKEYGGMILYRDDVEKLKGVLKA